MNTNKPFALHILTLQKEVTGSLYHFTLTTPNGNYNFIMECGIFQEGKYKHLNYIYPFDPRKLIFAAISHNHADHLSGLPYLFKASCNSTMPVYCAKTNDELFPIALKDSYKINKRDDIYSYMHVHEAIKSLVPVAFNKSVQITENIKMTLCGNGHILGAAVVVFELSFKGEENINLIFSGDYKKNNIFFDIPAIPKRIKNLKNLHAIVESTYGSTSSKDISYHFKDDITKLSTDSSVKTVIFPCISQRIADILYYLKKAQDKGTLNDSIKIVFDTPLGMEYLPVFSKHYNHDFMPKNLIFVNNDNRHEIMNSKSKKIILTTSANGDNGPMMCYIPKFVSDTSAVFYYTSYVQSNSPSARLLNHKDGDTIQVDKKKYTIKANVMSTNQFSSHAKNDELIDFLRQFPNLRSVFVSHGSTENMEYFKNLVQEKLWLEDVCVLNRSVGVSISSSGIKTYNSKISDRPFFDESKKVKKYKSGKTKKISGKYYKNFKRGKSKKAGI